MSDPTGDGEDAAPPPAVTLSPTELRLGLIAASKLGRASLAERLVSLGGAATLEADARGWTPLHYASFYGHHDVVDVLLRAGAGEPFVTVSGGVAAGALASPTATMGGMSDVKGGGGAAERASRRDVHVVDSPLHWAVSRGALRVVWSLLIAGLSPCDIDNMGNTALHLAAAAAVSSAALRAELVATVLGAGADPAARNWAGQTAAEMLPPVGATAAAKMLARAVAETHCASTHEVFGPDLLRFQCASTGAFFSESASVATCVPAFAPVLPGVTVPAPATSDAAAVAPLTGSLSAPDDEGAEYGLALAGIPGAPLLAVFPGDLDVMRPVRFGTQVSYKVDAAEKELAAAMAPFANAARAAESAFKAAVKTAAAAASAAVAATATAAEGGEGEDGGASASSAQGDSADAAAPTRPVSAAQAPPALTPSKPPATEAAATGINSDSPRGSSSPTNTLDTLDIDFSPSVVLAAAPAAPAVPLDLLMTPAHVDALAAAVDVARDLHANVQTIAAALSTLAMLRAADAARASAVALVAARPLKSRADAALLDAEIKASAAAALGASKPFLGLLRVGRALALAELDVTNAVAVAARVTIATHAADAVLARLEASVSRAAGLAALADKAASGEDADEATQEAIEAAGSVGGTSVVSPPAAATAADPSPSVTERAPADGDDDVAALSGASSLAAPEAPLVFRLGLAPLPARLPPIIPVTADALAEAGTLAARLRAEISISDDAALAEAACAAAVAAATAHAEDDPTSLPTPPLPPAPVEAPAAAKGGKEKAPPPKPAAKPAAKGKEPVVAEEPPHPPVDAAFPVDVNGVPLPHTPQLLALFALRDACAALDAGAARGAAAGADAAAVAGAVSIAAKLKAGLAESLLAECLRVEAARAKKKKGGAKGAKKK